MMTAYRIGLLVVATFAFVTLYDRGPANFPANAAAEFSAFTGWLRGLSGR